MEERRQSLRRVSLDNEIDRYSPSKERYTKSDSFHQLPTRHSSRNSYKERIDYSEDPPLSTKRSRRVIDDDDDENNENNDNDDEGNDENISRYPRRSTRKINDTIGNNDVINSKRSREMIDSTSSNRSSSRNQSWRNNKNQYEDDVIQQDEDDDGNQDDDNDDEEEEEEDGPKYSFRNREITKRETMNISTLGGDGGGLKQNNNPFERERMQTRDSGGSHGRNYVDPQPRLYLGGKLPSYGRRGSRNHHRHRHSSSSRRHYDSSSESSSSSASRGKKSRRRSYSSDDDTGFNNYENKRVDKERDSIQPINFLEKSMGGSVKDKASARDLLRADVMPVAVDSKIGFDSVGGLEKHIHSLKEMVVLPLLYPDVFERFDTQPPRGVLFVGPPGTGKTLTARALANSLSTGTTGGQKVSFFMRKGADCLSKWVGEGERQLRLLFEQAKRYQPSIIFFDEIDGLAPVRSVKQDQIHASIVSTLLALMDGLDSRGQVVVIGATNRPDAIDAALRRPGRFDRELLFSLPDAKARSAILDIHTEKWDPPLTKDVKDWIVDSTAGYCGADIKAFCAEAALVALKRAYPQIYNSANRLALDPARLALTKGDFAVALNKIVPASHRSTSTQGRPLDSFTSPLLSPLLKNIETKLHDIFPFIKAPRTQMSTVTDPRTEILEDSESWISSLTDVQDFKILQDCVPDFLLLEPGNVSNSSANTVAGHESRVTAALYNPASITFRPRLMIAGKKGNGQMELGCATLFLLESFPTFCLDYPSLVSDINSHSPEQALVIRVQEAMRVAPSVLYLPDIISWWRSASESLRMALVSIIDSSPNLPVLWVSTMIIDEEVENAMNMSTDKTLEANDILEDRRLMHVLSWLSSESKENISSVLESPGVINVDLPKEMERNNFFSSFFNVLPLLPAKIYAAKKKVLSSSTQSVEISKEVPNNSIASRLPKRKTKETATKTNEPDPINDDRDKQSFREIRNFFRASLSELHKEKKCLIFWRPVDPTAVPDYYDIITSPMDLETMRMKVDNHMYHSLRHFLRDIEQIAFNAREYNPATLKDQRGRSIVHASNSMVDMIESHAYNFKKEIGYDLFRRCEEACERRGIPDPLPIVSGAEMPEENKKFYAEILSIHKELKVQDGHDCDNQDGKDKTDEIPSERPIRSRNGGEKTTFADLDLLPDSRKKKPKPIDTNTIEEKKEGKAMSLEDRDAGSIEKEKLETAEVETAEVETAEVEAAEVETPNEVAIMEIPELPPLCIEELPIIIALKDSISIANTLDTRNLLDDIQSKFVQGTHNFSIYDLVSIMTQLNRLSKEFIGHGDWNVLIDNLRGFSQNFQARF